MYLHDFADGGFTEMVRQFSHSEDGPIDVQESEILLATYIQPSYEGYAFVLFARDGKLYEVNASHCSCYGLEGKWRPEETSSVALRARMADGELGRDRYDEGGVFADELRAVLDAWDAVNA